MSSYVRRVEVEHLADVWCEGTSILLDLLFVFEVWVVGFCLLEKLIRGMQLIMIIIIVPHVSFDQGLVDGLCVRGSEFDHDLSFLRN